MRYNGKKEFICTSRTYDHSTEVSAGLECDGGETSIRFEKNL